MADSLADYSKIQELLEIRRLYEEMQERHQSELDEANSRVEYLESELRSRANATSASGERVHELEEEGETEEVAVEEPIEIPLMAVPDIAELESRVLDDPGAPDPHRSLAEALIEARAG